MISFVADKFFGDKFCGDMFCMGSEFLVVFTVSSFLDSRATENVDKFCQFTWNLEGIRHFKSGTKIQKYKTMNK